MIDNFDYLNFFKNKFYERKIALVKRQIGKKQL